MKKLMAILIMLLLASPAWGATYYVNSASSGGDGTTTATSGATAAFATVAAAQAALTGDQSDNFLYFNKGNTWREQFTVGGYGTSGHPFTIGAYGTGAAPIILGTTLVSTWTQHITNLLPNDADGGFTSWDTGALPAGWSQNGTPDASNYTEENPDNNLHLVSNGTYIGIRAASSLVGGTLYAYSIRVTANTSGSLKIRFGTSATDVVISGVGTYTGTATQTATYTLFDIQRNAACNITIDNLLVGLPNIWKATLATEPNRVWFDGTVGTKAANLAAVNATNEWFWASGILYVYSTVDPDTLSSPGMEVTTATAAINTNAKSYVTIDGLSIQKAVNGVYVSVADATTPTNIIVQNNTISDVDLSAVLVGDTTATHQTPQSVTITGNTLTNWHRKYPGVGSGYSSGTIWAPAIYVLDGDNTGGDNLTVSGNTITSDITGNNANQYRDGIVVHSGDNITITQNTITGSDHGIVVAGPGSVGFVDTYTITKNYVHDTADDGIWLRGVQSTDSLTAYNLLVRNADQGIATQSCGAGSYGSIDNNTIISSYECSVLFIFGIGGTNLRNNIIYEYATANSNADPTNGQVVAAVCLSTGTATLGSGTVDNNIYYKSGNSTPFYELTLTARTLAQWKTDMSKDANSLNADPLFVDAANNNFRPTPSSPVISAGVNVGLTTDYAGVTLPAGAGYEIGVYEYGHIITIGGGTSSLTW